MSDTSLLIPNSPPLPGLVFRRFRGESDYPSMAALIGACKLADGVERSSSVEDVAQIYRHLENCDPQADMLFAEVDGQVIAYGRLLWLDQVDGSRVYIPVGFLHPTWRGKGLGSAIWAAGEERARQIASGHPREMQKFLQISVFETEKALISLLERSGYQAVRYETHMVRDLSEPFPAASMPPGLQVRPVRPDHLRPIFDASNEAFRDHWGAHEATEAEYRAELDSKEFRPELWKVAWAGDQVASVVHNFVNEDENNDYQRKRGYTEGICTRRPWRKLGLARSLLVQSMQMFKEMGFTETALSVDSQNLSGAFRLYEGVGYHRVHQQTIYRKPME